MSVMIDLPPVMMKEARDYAAIRGTTLEHVLFECIAVELERNRKRSETAAKLMDRWRALVRKGRGRLTEPYRFNRADAYPEGEYA